MKVLELKNKIDLSEIVNKYVQNKTNELPVASNMNFDIPKSNPMLDRITSVPYFPREVETMEDVKEKRKIIIHIKNYLKEFPTSLTEFKTINYSNKSIAELNNIMEEIKLTVCHSNSGGLLLGVFQGACDVLESAAPMVSYDLTGLKYIATKNPNIINSVKEISLEYQNLNYIPPEKRLGLLLLQMCYALNSMNKMNKKIENKLDKIVPEDITDKYVEL